MDVKHHVYLLPNKPSEFRSGVKVEVVAGPGLSVLTSLVVSVD